MSIPIKGSRKITVAATSYRFLLRKDRERRGRIGQRAIVSGCRVLTVQKVSLSSGKAEGQVLQVKLYSKVWCGLDDDEERANEVTVTPEDVSRVIQTSLKQGWSPESQGGVFTTARINMENWETLPWSSG